MSGRGVIPQGIVEMLFQEEEEEILENQTQETSNVFNFCTCHWKEELPNYCVTLPMNTSWVKFVKEGP